VSEPRVHAGKALPWRRQHPVQAAWIALIPVLLVIASAIGGVGIGIVVLPLILPGLWFGVLRVNKMLNPDRTFDHNGRMTGR